MDVKSYLSEKVLDLHKRKARQTMAEGMCLNKVGCLYHPSRNRRFLYLDHFAFPAVALFFLLLLTPAIPPRIVFLRALIRK